MENSPDHSPTFSLLSPLLGSLPLTPLIFGHLNIFSVFIVKSSGYWHSNCSYLLTHLFCETRLPGNIWPAIGSLRSDSVEPISLVSRSLSMLSHSLGKANQHSAEIPENTLSGSVDEGWGSSSPSPLEAGPHSVWKSGPQTHLGFHVQ